MKYILITEIKEILSNNTIDKYRLVYCITKIRKYLELNNKKAKYKYLNFYCNWALHSVLDYKKTTDLIKEYILEIDNPNRHDKLYFLSDFFDEIKRFCNEECNFLYNADLTNEIREILHKTYSDVPLTLTKEVKYKYEYQMDGKMLFASLTIIKCTDV